jgi:hypothetical protein
LILDIETAPHKAYIWDCRTEYVSPDHIVEPGYTLCWAAKWLDDDGVMFGSVHRHGKGMVRSVHKLLNRADAVVHFNGKKFDVPTLNREFLLAGLSPPSPFKQIDLLQTCRRKFKFASNRLDYVSRVLGIGAKIEHKGMELWKECMAGLPEAWATMEAYNKGDVRLTQAVYERLLPWIDGHPNVAAFQTEKRCCPTCGSTKLQARGEQVTTTLVYTRLQCRSCGKWSRQAKAKKYQRPELVAA